MAGFDLITKDIAEFFEAANPMRKFPRLRVNRGTKLFHGTDVKANFRIPRGPAWFSVSYDVAEGWIGWATNENPGQNRVLEYALVAPLSIIDMSDRAVYEAVAEHVMGDSEPLIFDFAKALGRVGEPGWVFRAGGHLKGEVMLTQPKQALQFVKVHPIS